MRLIVLVKCHLPILAQVGIHVDYFIYTHFENVFCEVEYSLMYDFLAYQRHSSCECVNDVYIYIFSSSFSLRQLVTLAGGSLFDVCCCLFQVLDL